MPPSGTKTNNTPPRAPAGTKDKKCIDALTALVSRYQSISIRDVLEAPEITDKFGHLLPDQVAVRRVVNRKVVAHVKVVGNNPVFVPGVEEEPKSVQAGVAPAASKPTAASVVEDEEDEEEEDEEEKQNIVALPRDPLELRSTESGSGTTPIVENGFTGKPFRFVLNEGDHSAGTDLHAFFAGGRALHKDVRLEGVLLGQDETAHTPQYGAIGSTVPDESRRTDADTMQCDDGILVGDGGASHRVYLNTHAPFCLLAVGVQGSGKSHSIATVVESSMLHMPPFIEAEPQVTTMVFHYDQSQDNYCELHTLTRRHRDAPTCIPVVSRMIILVSPSYYAQRKEYYKNVPNCEVFPLLFSWADLDAAQIKQLMRLEVDGNVPLYMASILDMLRKMQKKGTYPTYASFKAELTKMDLTGQQSSPLTMRLQVLESFLTDSPENKNFSRLDFTATLNSPLKETPLIIVDLTDPLLTPPEANSIFQVLFTKFVTTPTKAGKLAVFDEAHKYISASSASTPQDGLSAALVSAVRQMRHHGLRVAISTQNPKGLPGELLDLVSVALIHRFHSRDWFDHLRHKLPLTPDLFDHIMALRTGEALIFSPRWAPSLRPRGCSIKIPTGVGAHVRQVAMRERITADGGVSKVALRAG
ncbi:uncharacterized protein EV422DRAFT_530646 [Fimicolochytrium jonesii]|uniref:uncharacterized protein n=1 Tax=Fimicolochytrium jonesii TaxID=1396493 RepID=UPI0022FE92C3|nr:uncharacterized protein EV422DRAFT_530646 [Fimicolochytrium jonesii]KAI8820372.1 hypothetical protein EV422DRAFT_530646 [Fimicolochytrium jonesii]